MDTAASSFFTGIDAGNDLLALPRNSTILINVSLKSTL